MTTAARKIRSRGAAIIEFTFVGIPLIFMLISIFEASRGMWIYTTMAHAFKEGARRAVVRGSDFYTVCQLSAPSNPACTPLNAQKVAQAILQAGPGLIDTDVINVAFSVDNGGTWTPCPGSGTLHDCVTSGTAVTWTTGALSRGQSFAVRGQYRFASAIAMFWPGAGRGVTFGTFNLPASSQDRIQF